jgi:hypothetical protein
LFAALGTFLCLLKQLLTSAVRHLQQSEKSHTRSISHWPCSVPAAS